MPPSEVHPDLSSIPIPESELSPGELVESPVSPPAIPEETIVLPPEDVEHDVVLTSVKDDDTPEKVLKAVIYGLAEEQSSLRELRQVKRNEKKDTSNISLKRGQLLKFMSETLLQKQALSGNANAGEMDLRGPRFRTVFKMFLQTISDTFDEIKIPPEYKEMFFQKLTTNMEGWEERAEKALKKSEPK